MEGGGTMKVLKSAGRDNTRNFETGTNPSKIKMNSTGIYICICVVRGHSSICTEHHQYVSMDITYNIVWITRVRLPILLVVR